MGGENPLREYNILTAIIILAVVLLGAWAMHRIVSISNAIANAYTASVEAVVVDKSTSKHTMIIGKMPYISRSYSLEVRLNESDIKYVIATTSEEYNNIEIGDTVMVTLKYNENNEVIDIVLGATFEAVETIEQFNGGS